VLTGWLYYLHVVRVIHAHVQLCNHCRRPMMLTVNRAFHNDSAASRLPLSALRSTTLVQTKLLPRHRSNALCSESMALIHNTIHLRTRGLLTHHGSCNLPFSLVALFLVSPKQKPQLISIWWSGGLIRGSSTFVTVHKRAWCTRFDMWLAGFFLLGPYVSLRHGNVQRRATLDYWCLPWANSLGL